MKWSLRTPIRTRLTALYCTIFCLSTILLEIAAYAGLRSSISAVVDSELQSRLIGVVGFLDEHVARRPLPKLQSELATHAALNPEFLQIDRLGDGQLYRGRWVADVKPVHPATESAVFFSATKNNAPLRFLCVRRRIKNQEYELTLGADFTVAAEILRRFRWLVFLSSPIVFGCAVIAGYSVSKRALQPVSRLTNAARSIGALNLSQRLDVPESADELQDLAETLNRMLSRIEGAFRHVSQFTANASHELRTPLALIRATAEVALLRTGGTVDHYSEALHRVLREAEKNSALLDDMLRLARAEYSAGSLVLQPINFDSHMGAICERVLPLALEKGVHLERQVSAHDLWVLADSEHLKRLWLILLDNAIRYTPAGGVIRVSWYAATTESLICEVSDTGIGISEADLPHIFERFFRADKARSREEGGAGLGLALARLIVDAHRAAIEVESIPGRGSTVRVHLLRPIRVPIEDVSPTVVDAEQSVRQLTG